MASILGRDRVAIGPGYGRPSQFGLPEAIWRVSHFPCGSRESPHSGFARHTTTLRRIATPLAPVLAPSAIDDRGEVWALQYPFSLDEGPLSTHAPGDHGFSTVNCYLIRDKSDSLLIDTGFTSHRDALVADVTSLISKDGKLSLFPLRFGEFNSICNIVPLVGLMKGGTLYSSALGDARAAIPFHPRDTPFGAPNVPEALAGVELATGRPGTPVTVGSKELE